MIKKLLLSVTFFAVAIMSYAQTTALKITEINGMAPDAYKATLTDNNLIEGSTLALTVEYTDVREHPSWGCVCIRARFLDNFDVIGGTVLDTNVTTDANLQTITINITVPDVAADIDPARIQILSKNDEGGNSLSYAGDGFGGNKFVIKDLTTLSTESVIKNKLTSTFYSASKEAIVVNDKIEGKFSIFNLLGQSVLKGKISKEINVKDLTPGLYILSTEHGRLKFVK